MPVFSAAVIGGSAPGMTSVARRNDRENSAVSRRNGRWTRKERMPTSIVGALLRIVSRRRSGKRDHASKVSAPASNEWA